MARRRFTVLLPIASVLITSGLWLWSRQQYHSRVQPWPEMWTDYTPVSLEVAGAINVPTATFGYPLYHLLHDETKTWELMVLLFGVAVQWAYIGFVVDTRKTRRQGMRRGRIASAIGFLSGIFVLVVTIPMHHVAAIYQFAAVMWSFVICAHFLYAFRNRASVP